MRQSEWERAGAEQGFLYYSLSLDSALPAPSLLLWGCSRFNCYEICRSRKEQKMSCQSLCSGDSYHMKARELRALRRCRLRALSLGNSSLCYCFDGNPTRTKSMREFQLRTRECQMMRSKINLGLFDEAVNFIIIVINACCNFKYIFLLSSL